MAVVAVKAATAEQVEQARITRTYRMVGPEAPPGVAVLNLLDTHSLVLAALAVRWGLEETYLPRILEVMAYTVLLGLLGKPGRSVSRASLEVQSLEWWWVILGKAVMAGMAEWAVRQAQSLVVRAPMAKTVDLG